MGWRRSTLRLKTFAFMAQPWRSTLEYNHSEKKRKYKIKIMSMFQRKKSLLLIFTIVFPFVYLTTPTSPPPFLRPTRANENARFGICVISPVVRGEKGIQAPCFGLWGRSAEETHISHLPREKRKKLAIWKMTSYVERWAISSRTGKMKAGYVICWESPLFVVVRLSVGLLTQPLASSDCDWFSSKKN